jgi:hypothetical protein
MSVFGEIELARASRGASAYSPALAMSLVRPLFDFVNNLARARRTYIDPAQTNLRTGNRATDWYVCSYIGFRGKAVIALAPQDVRFWPKADTGRCTAHVRFWG